MNTREIIKDARNSERFLEKVYALKNNHLNAPCLDFKINTDLCYKNILYSECKKTREQLLSTTHNSTCMQLQDVLEYRLYSLLCSLMYKK